MKAFTNIYRRRQNTAWNSFTLIELLVVIAIITILVAMLLPALQQARERARSSACVSNLKNWAMANSFYHQESNDFLLGNMVVNAQKSSFATTPTVGWNDYRSSFRQMIVSDDMDAWGGYDRWQGGYNINGCPSVTSVSGKIYRRMSYRINYGVARNNLYQWSVYLGIGRWQKVAHVRNPSSVPQFGEGDGGNSAILTNSTIINPQFFKHNGHMNVAYVAGNVGTEKVWDNSRMKEVWNLWP